jgi:hypothetical protein
MMMVETYNAMPQFGYQGKYPRSMVSPPEIGKETPQQNGKEENQKPHSPLRSPVHSPERKPSPSPRGRGTSRTLVDSYRPSSPNRPPRRSSGSARSHSRGHPAIDRYISPDLRRREVDIYIPRDGDIYVPPPRKRSIDDDSTNGREKRKRSEETEEGEIR